MKIISIGGSGASRSSFSIIKKFKNLEMIGFLDNRLRKDQIVDGFSCLGEFSKSSFYRDLGYKFITGIGSQNTFQEKRNKIKSYNLLNEDFIKIVSPNSIVETSENAIKEGCLIFDNVFIGFEVNIGFLSLINTKTYVGHESKIGDYCIVGPNSTICGNVNIHSSVYIGAGSVIRDHITICENVLIGCGSVVTKNISHPGIYAGVPAKLIKYWENDNL